MKKKNQLAAPIRVYISGLEIENYKGFGKKQEIKLAPKVNLIFGKNSSGKSSIFQSLRILRQSYSKGNLTPLELQSPNALRNAGGIDLDLDYSGLIHNNKTKNKLSLGIETNTFEDSNKVNNERKKITYSYKFDKNFYKTKYLISEKIILDKINIENENIKFTLNVTSHKFLNEGSDKYLRLENLYRRNRGNFAFRFGPIKKLKKDDEYESVYKPYYYNIEIDQNSIEIKNIDEIENLLNQLGKENIIKFFTKLLSLWLKEEKEEKNNKNLGISPFLMRNQNIQIIRNILHEKEAVLNQRIEKLLNVKNILDYFKFEFFRDIRFFSPSKRVVHTKKIVDEIIKIISFLKNKKSNFKNFIIKDICKKVKNKVVFYKGSFIVDNTNDANQLQRPYEEEIDGGLLFSGNILFQCFVGKKLFKIFDTYEKSGPFEIGQLRNRNTHGSIYSHLEICMEKTLIMPGLRSLPSKYYVKGLPTSYVGPRAENIAEILVNPEFKKNINKWLKLLEVPYTIDVKKSGNYYELVFKTKSKVDVTQTHVGLGYPMILPFMIQSLVARNKIILIEEPELHLHPKLEADLADLITYSSNVRENQFIIETHSEDFLLRILKHIRLKNLKPEDISINYVSNDKKIQSSKVEFIKVNSEGSYTTSWKDDIFSERYREFDKSPSNFLK